MTAVIREIRLSQYKYTEKYDFVYFFVNICFKKPVSISMVANLQQYFSKIQLLLF